MEQEAETTPNAEAQVVEPKPKKKKQQSVSGKGFPETTGAQPDQPNALAEAIGAVKKAAEAAATKLTGEDGGHPEAGQAVGQAASCPGFDFREGCRGDGGAGGKAAQASS